jgi:endonuclease/exonuclease/phosphatase family metal-dependent hydrolase
VSEVDTLASWLERLRLPGEPVILGGDFNCEPGSAPMKTLARHGWGDAWAMARDVEDDLHAATWDPTRNPLAWRSQNFHQQGEDYSPTVRELLKRVDALARRIDYLFVYPPHQIDDLGPSSDLGCLGNLRKAQRFGYLTGNPLSHEGLVVDLEGGDYGSRAPHAFTVADTDRFVSDHFGVYAEFGITSEPTPVPNQD